MLGIAGPEDGLLLARKLLLLESSAAILLSASLSTSQDWDIRLYNLSIFQSTSIVAMGILSPELLMIPGALLPVRQSEAELESGSKVEFLGKRVCMDLREEMHCP